MNKLQKLSPEKYIITKGSQLPFHECFINENWLEEGMASITISKKMPSDKLIIGAYVVDIFCLGLKNTLFKFALDTNEYASFLEQISKQQELVKCDLAEAHNIIYGAIDYAESIGFKPQKDFRITEFLLDSDLINDGIDEIEFGKNGKPFYFAGPYDNTKQIIGILEKNVGKDNFEFSLPIDGF